MDHIKLSRKLMEWEWYRNINTCRLFIHMLLKANWKDGKFEGKVIPRGSFVSSIGNLANETSLTNDEVRTALKHLISTNEITKQSFSKYTVFTVKNYSKYQDVPKQITNQSPSNSHSIPNLFPTIEEKKEGKKGRNNIPPISPTESIQQFLAAYPCTGNTYLVEVAFVDCLLTKHVTEEQLIVAAGNYADRCKRLKTDKQYMKLPENFLRDMEYCQYLPGVYEPPEPKVTKNANNGMMQANYGDMSVLEKELLSN